MQTRHLLLAGLLGLVVAAGLLVQQARAQAGNHAALELARAVAARPLSVDAQTKALEAPILTSEFDVHTTAVGTTAVSGTASDVAAADRLSSTAKLFVQNLRVTNRSASQGVCYWVKDFATSCTNACTTAPKTCSGAATDGDFIAAGAWLPISITGDECLCLIAPGASTTTTVARVQRYAE